jgi:peptidoglycan/xylan/chitin deacetylase (PgdA/CDA1 family)
MQQETATRDSAKNGSDVAPPIVHDVLRSAGKPLDPVTRSYMEPRFGSDFSGVRVHSGGDAARSAEAVGARAYTVGQHIVMRDSYSPRSHEGKSLLAHELAHTVQQRGAQSRGDALPVSGESDSSEHEAHEMAQSAAASRATRTPSAAPPHVARATRPFLLTFDDGPDGANPLGGKNLTEKVLNQLCEKSVQAGFFVQTAAENAAGKPFRGSSTIGETLIKRMNSEGHQVGIHTGGKADHESHPSAEKGGRLTSELTAAKTAITKLTGKTPTMVRPPFGSTNKAVKAVYKSLALTNVLWDIDGDAKAKSLADIKANITRDLSAVIKRGWKGSTALDPTIVALFHDIRPNTAKNVGPIIDFIRSETTKLSGGKDTATFPSITCGKEEPVDYGPGDYEMPKGDERVAGGAAEGSAEDVA